MIRTLASLTVAAGAVLFAASAAEAQVVTYYSPVVAAPTVSYYASPVVYNAPVAYSSPVVTTVARPVTYTTGFVPTATVRTRFRPILGGTVSRVRYGYRPVTYVGW